jgi:hypothetical protein
MPKQLAREREPENASHAARLARGLRAKRIAHDIRRTTPCANAEARHFREK